MKHLFASLGLLLAITLTSPALADSTISGLNSGGTVQTQDQIPVYRPSVPGTDFKVSVGSAATQAIGTSGPVVPLLSTANTWSGLQSFLSGDMTAADPVFSGGSITLPAGTTSQRPGSPVNGMIRYNSTTPGVEGYVNGAWGPLGGSSSSGITGFTGVITASGTGSVATTFGTFPSSTLAAAISDETGSGSVVFGTAPTISGATITSTSINGVTPTTTGSATTFLNGAGAYTTPTTSGGVTTFNTRSGAVVPASGDYTVSQITGAAPLASPTFTGTVTLPAATSVNGVTLTTGGSATAFLNGAGAYATPAGGSLPTSTTLNPQILTVSAQSGASASSLVNSYTVQADPILLPNFRKCLANVKTGAGRCRVVPISDSTAYGYGSQGAGTDVKTYSWPAQLAKAIQSTFGVPSDYDGFFGDSNGQYNTGHDPRLNCGSNGWGPTVSGATATTAGGSMITNQGTSGLCSFTAIKPVDTYKVWYPVTTGLGTVLASIDSGTATSLVEAGTSAIASANITTTNDGKNHTLNLNQSGSTSFLIGMEGWDSKHPGVSIIPAAWYGSNTTTDQSYGWTWNGNAWSPLNALAAVCGDLNIIALDLNDATGATGITAYKANLNTMIAKIQSNAACGDIVIATEGHENNGSGANDAIITPYVQAAMQVAASYSPPIPVIDNYDRQGTGAYVSSRGWFYSDNVHYNAQGYSDIAQGDVRALYSMVGEGSGIGPALSQEAAAGDVNFLNAFSSGTGSSPVISAYGSDTNIGITLAPKGSGSISFTGPAKLMGYTVSTLPTGTLGAEAYVTDSTACTLNGSLTGGGSTFCPVIYNGSAWVGG